MKSEKDKESTAEPVAADPPPAEEKAPAPYASMAAILNMPEPRERPTAEMTIEAHGQALRWEIYTDGMADAQRWAQLTNDLLYGHTQQQMAKISKTTFGEKIILPNGTPIFVDDPGYLGSVRVLAAVLKTPEITFDALLIAGHKLGKPFLDLCNWAAQQNGVSEHAMNMMQDLVKNAEPPDPSATS